MINPIMNLITIIVFAMMYIVYLKNVKKNNIDSSNNINYLIN